VDGPAQPLYPFGHGGSYTKFSLTHPALAATEVSCSDAIVASIDVTNTGDRDGEEVVQLYVRDPAASVTRPVLELKGFVRVALTAGESRTVTFEIPVGMLGCYDRDLRYVVESGDLVVFAGTSSAYLVEVGTVNVTADAASFPPTKMYEEAVTVS
jgi:beta-glucosidase